eukprot:CAMPEP_0201544612 /NCGR_PEP_ID=MMETSP0173_2-20130828/1258_1 /ASSEMBLY_ACC=CAM_ASM_000268 /TAXON_ID=218659 /ORGANISM="Vexillifera sp., Strain DIVA3 564/2" /LENGTH=57 /DNA_ID=CAMNT_0047952799 /DNA_START=118 /DNA_END=288 /DNA_ORIENTATION=-
MKDVLELEVAKAYQMKKIGDKVDRFQGIVVVVVVHWKYVIEVVDVVVHWKYVIEVVD